MASAGIRKTPTGRYKVWWRLADASQGSQTFATRDQARDFSTTCSPGWPVGAGSTHNSAGRPSRPWAREWREGWSASPDHSHGHSKPQRRACGGTCVGLGYQTTGEAWLAASAAARAREARRIAREELRTGTIAA